MKKRISKSMYKRLTSSTKKKALCGSVRVLSSVQCVDVQLCVDESDSTVRLRITGTRKLGWVFKQNDKIDVQMKNTDTSPTNCTNNSTDILSEN